MKDLTDFKESSLGMNRLDLIKIVQNPRMIEADKTHWIVKKGHLLLAQALKS